MSSFEKHHPKEIITNPESIADVYKILPHKKSIKSIHYEYEPEAINYFMHKNNLDEYFYSLSTLFLSYLNHYFKNILENNGLLVKPDCDSDYLFLDDSTMKYLECVNNLEQGEKENTLYELLDQTKTKMGSRLLKKWILYPLCNKDKIESRQKYIEFFLQNKQIREDLQSHIAAFGDIEKLFQRIRLGKWRDKDFFTLLQFKRQYIACKEYLTNQQFLFQYISFSISDEIIDFIEKAINDDSTFKINDENLIIKPSFNSDLQKKYFLLSNQEEAIETFCQKEKTTTGITDLCIKKSPLYQYVFELSKIKEKKYTLPDSYIRVQTLTQKERYTSIELQQLSSDIINVQEDYLIAEKKVKEILIQMINNHINSIYEFIEKLSLLDVYTSFAQCAEQYRWTKPIMMEKGSSLQIISGQHPIASNNNMRYIANSLFLDTSKKTYIITGPNMGGKSTFMRQNALLVLLAHIGSYIPVTKSHIPIMEKILTRVGASDNLHQGKSTFFTELEEIKTILIAANQYSFIIIDEIGRGTSTYDGVAIAASTIEYLLQKNPYLLCSTHYHELGNLLTQDTIAWYYMNTSIKNDSIAFLYTIIAGKSDNSMGIALAKKIGLPQSVIMQAEKYFNTLHKKNIVRHTKPIDTNKKIGNASLIYEEIIHQLGKKNMDDISPKQAYSILEKIYTIFKKTPDL